MGWGHLHRTQPTPGQGVSTAGTSSVRSRVGQWSGNVDMCVVELKDEEIPLSGVRSGLTG